VGLVIERERLTGEMDGLRWYIPGKEGKEVLFEDWFHCTDLGTQLKPVIEQYFASDAYKTKTPLAGAEYPLLGSESTVQIKGDLEVGNPYSLDAKFAAMREISISPDDQEGDDRWCLLCGEGEGPGTEFVAEAHFGGKVGSPSIGALRWQRRRVLGESWWYQTRGRVSVTVHAVEQEDRRFVVEEGAVLLLPPLPTGAAVTACWAPDAEGIVVTSTVVHDV